MLLLLKTEGRRPLGFKEEQIGIRYALKACSGNCNELKPFEEKSINLYRLCCRGDLYR